MTVEELKVQFTANISEFKKKTEEMKKEISSLGNLSDELQADIDNALSSPSKEAQKIGKELSTLGQKLSKSVSEADKSYEKISVYTSEIEKLKNKYREQTAQLEEQEKKVGSLKSTYESIRAVLNKFGSDIPLNTQLENARKETNAIGAQIDELQKKLYRKQSGRSFDSGVEYMNEEKVTAQIEELKKKFDEALRKEKELKNALSSLGPNADLTNKTGIKQLEKDLNSASSVAQKLRSEIGSTNSKIDSLSLNAASEFRKIEAAQPNLSKTKAEIEKNRSELQKLTSPLALLKARFSNTFKKATSDAKGTEKTINRMHTSLRRLPLVAAGLSIIKGIFGSLRSAASEYISTHDELEKKVTIIKNSIGQSLAPTINVIITLFEKVTPYIMALIDLLNEFINKLMQIAGLTQLSDALNNVTEATKKTSKAQKDLYSFDKINRQSDDSDLSSSTSGSQTNATFSVTDEIKAKVAEIVGIGAMLLLVLGTILAFSGANIPLGLGLIATGAIGLAAVLTTSWDTLTDETKRKIEVVMSAVGVAALAIGAILAFSGANIPLGIALMAVGGVTLASMVALNWDSMTEKVSGAWNTVSSWWTNNVSPLIAELQAKISEKFEEAREKWHELKDKTSTWWTESKEKAKNKLSEAKDKWNNLKDKTSTWWRESKEKGKNKFSEAKKKWDSLKNRATTWKADAKEKTKNVVTNLKNKWDSVKSKGATLTAEAKEKAQGALDKMKQKWNGFSSKAVELTTSLKDSVSAAFQSMVKKIIDTLNSWIDKINDLVPGTPIKKKFEYPKFATGGIINKPTYGQIGEDGAEAIVPLERNLGWLDRLAELFASKTVGSVSAVSESKSVVIPIYIGNRKLATYVVDDINNITETTGVCPVKTLA